MIYIAIIVLIFVLKIVIVFFKYMDYWAVGLVPFFVLDLVFGVDLFAADMHTVFKILIFLAPCAIWFFLSNLVHIGEFYPFKLIGAIICGVFIAKVVSDLVEMDMIWTITVGVVGTVLVGVSRIIPLDFG